jgi:uncharacterized Fe-S cluster-containing radical SAM superfamily enzyme
MSQSSNQFLALQEQDFYNASTKARQQMAEYHIQQAIEHEHHDIVLAKAKKLNEYLEVLEKGIKKDLLPKINGQYYSTEIDVKLSQRTTPNYKEDEEWVQLNKALKEREELLKMRIMLGKVIYDNEGVEVPLIGSSNTEFLTIKLK